MRLTIRWMRVGFVLALMAVGFIFASAQTTDESIPTDEHEPTVAVEWMDLLYLHCRK